MADFKTTNIYGDIYVNNKVGINTNVPATRLQIGQLSPTSVTEGLQFGDDPGTRIYRSAAGTLTLSGSVAGLTLSASTALYGNYGDWSGELNKIQWHSNNLYFVNRGGGSWLFRNSGGSNVVSFSSAGAIDGLSITTTVDGANHIMAGSANAEGIRMQAASSSTYPVFLRSLNPVSGGETSPWIYKEAATDWGIWHNNPINSIDFTKQGSVGIATSVGGSSTNVVTVRVEMATGFVQTIAGYRNSAGTTILSDSGNITGTSTNITAYTINQNLGTTNSPTFAAITGTGALTVGNSLTRPASLATLNNYAARIGGTDVYLNIASLDATYNYPVAIQSGRNSDNANFPLLLNPNGGNITVGQYTGLGYTFGVAGTGYFSSSLTVGGPITGSAFSGAGTGLTGTAAGLSIGGSAASATSASYALNSTTAANVNNGTLTISTGTGIGVGTTTTFTANQSGNSTITLSNTGVTSAVAGTGVGVSTSTGAVTFSIGQAVGTSNTPTFAGATLNGQLNVNHSVSTAIVRLYNAGSTAWSLGVGDTAGTNFNISADFGSIWINKLTGNIIRSGSGFFNYYTYHREDITSLSSSATNLVQPLGTFDGANIVNAPTSGWYNYFSSTHGNYLTSLIANLHRTARWYVGYKEGPGGTPTNPTWYELVHTGFTGAVAGLTASYANALNAGNSYTVNSLTATSELGTRGTDIGANIERGSSALSTLRFDSDAFRFYAGGTGGIGEVLRVTEAGYVGIGTSTFAYGAANRGLLEVYGSTDALIALRNGTANSYIQKSANDFYLVNGGAGTISIYNNGSERMQINSSGNVGIGTSVPSSLLHLYNNDARYLTYAGSSGLTVQRNVLSGGGTTVLTLINTQGPGGASSNYGSAIQFDLGYGGTTSVVGTSARGAKISALNETVYTSTSTSQNAALVFFTSTTGSLSEKLRIRSDGSISPITVSSTTAGATLIKADGTNGTLFSVVDDLSDSLLSVNNGAGLPVFEVFADDRIVAGQYGQNDFVIVNNKVGIGTNNPIAELHVTGSSSIPSALFLGGNVGIGTTNPVYRLQVSGQTFLNNGTSNALQIQTVVADTTTRDAIYLYEDSSAATGRQAISWYNGNQSYYKARLWTEVGANYQATQFGIDVADDARTVATRLLIRNGNVGIGTTLPQALFHVNGLISGSSFTGAGTGLTGTAAGLSIGGSAGSATSATYAGYVTSLGSNLNYEPYSGSRATLFKASGLTHYSGYSNGTNRPTTFDYTLQVTDGGKGWEISMDWISLAGPAIFARSARDCCQGWSQWVRILDSVNYAYAANMNQNVRTSDNVTFGTVTATLSGNASSATSASYALNSTNAVSATSATNATNASSASILTTARNINGTSFNGSADITTANWGSSRTITIGSTGKSVNGSANVSWTLAEIGAGTGNGTVTSVATGDGLSGGPIATTGTITVDSTVVRTSNNQTIAGNKTFTGTSIVTGSIETVAVRETFAAVTTNTTVSIDLSTATVFNLSFTGTISKFNITNVNTAKVNSFTLISAPGAGAATITWTFLTNGLNEANVKWAGSAPTATTTTNRWDIFSFVYNGSAWYGFTGGLNYV